MRLPARLVVPLAALGLGLSVLPAAAGGPGALPERASDKARAALGLDDDEETAAAGPFDYIAQAGALSQPDFPETVTEITTIEAHDGEDLYVEITKPDPAFYGDGPWPVILEASPYHGTIADRIGSRMFPDPVDEEGNKLGLTGYFAPRGYAVAMMDLRGTGRSTGCLDHLGQNDKKDMKTVVESLADAEWSNGKVGMIGHSYVGSTPSLAAAANPRGLATIVPSAGLASMYDHQFQSGVPYNLQYIGPMVAYEGLALSRDLPGFVPAVPVVGGPTGDNFDENGPNPQTGCGLPNSAATAGSGQVTGQYELWHAQRDSRAGAAASDIPVFMIHGVNDNAARIPAAEWFFGNRFDREGDKVWIGQWDHGSTNGRCGDTDGNRALHPTCRFDQMQYALHAWFDKQLKGMDVDTGPAVEAFLNGEKAATASSSNPEDPATWGTKVVTADSWSRPSSALGLFPNAATGSLDLTPPTETASKTFNGGIQAGLARTGGAKLAFTSAPLAQDTVFLGLPQLDLRAAVTSPQQVTHLTAELFRVRPDGSREVANVCAIQPGLRFGVETLAPVVPGQAMDLPLQCFTAASLVKAGDKLQLEIGTNTPHHFTFASDPQVTVFTGPDTGGYRLPTVPATLYDDVPLREAASGDGGSEPAPTPVGTASAPVTASVVVPVGAVGQRVDGVTMESVEFTTDADADNAALEALATAGAPADLDLYLQRQEADGSWSGDLAAGESGSLEGEVLSFGRLAAGTYRLLVVNWAGAATPVDVEITFYNTAGEAGGAEPVEADAMQLRSLLIP